MFEKAKNNPLIHIDQIFKKEKSNIVIKPDETLSIESHSHLSITQSHQQKEPAGIHNLNEDPVDDEDVQESSSKHLSASKREAHTSQVKSRKLMNYEGNLNNAYNINSRMHTKFNVVQSSISKIKDKINLIGAKEALLTFQGTVAENQAKFKLSR